MLLNEFFGKAIDAKKGSTPDRNDGEEKMHDELFWFILDHDKLHKDYFHPLAVKIKRQLESKNLDKEECVGSFMPMVERGCKEFYTKKKMTGRLGKLFPLELREDLCERLFDHYKEDIMKDHYKLGY